MTPWISRLASLRGPLALLVAINFISSLGIGVMVPVIPLFAISLGASPLQIGLLITSFALANTAGQLVTGMLMDRHGSLLFLRTGTAVYAIGNGFSATARTVFEFIGFRGLAGLGAGGNILASRVYLAEISPPERMAFVNGVLGAAASSGQILGPAFGGAIVALFELRAPFAVVALTSGIAFFGLFLLSRPAHRTASAAELATAPTSMVNRSTLVLLFSNLFLSSAFGGFITTYAPYVTEVRGWTVVEVGLLFSFFGVGSIVFAAPLGHLADRIGRRIVAIGSAMPAALIGIFLLAGLPSPILYAAAVVGGGGISGFSAAWFALLNDASPRGRRGRTFGLVSALSNLGIVLGSMSATTVWQVYGLGLGLLVPSLAVIVAGLTLLALPGTRRAEPPRLIKETVAASAP